MSVGMRNGLSNNQQHIDDMAVQMNTLDNEPLLPEAVHLPQMGVTSLAKQTLKFV